MAVSPLATQGFAGTGEPSGPNRGEAKSPELPTPTPAPIGIVPVSYTHLTLPTILRV